MKPIRHAIIPAAGRGTRMSPITRVLPKELFPLGGKPLIQWCLDELVTTAIESVIVVISPEKEMISDFLLKVVEDDGLPFGERFDLQFLSQTEPHGVADAIAMAEPIVQNMPFHVLLPDNIFLHDVSPLVFLQDAFSENRRPLVALTPIRRVDAGLYGNCGQVEVEEMDSGRCRVTRVAEKRSGSFDMEGAGERLRIFPRYVLSSLFFDMFREMEGQWSGEKDDVPIFQSLASRGELMGQVIPGRGLDLGHEVGYLAASRYVTEGGD